MGKMSAQGWDVLLALIVAVVQVGGGVAANHNQTGLRSLDALGYALLVAGPLLLTVRRRYPHPVFYGVLAVSAAYLLVGYGYGPVFFSLIIAFLTAGIIGSRWATYPLVGVGYLLMVWPVPGWRGYDTTVWQEFGLLAWLVVLIAIAEGIRQRGLAVAARREREEEARRNEQAERERERAERARELAEREHRASEERLAIARELHDVLAHSLSLINVQSSVALELLDRKPEQAATALSAIKSASKDALGEVNALLRSIRSGTATVPAPTAPTVRISEIEGLIQPARTAGLEVRSIVTGVPQRLPSVVDVAAARIVQESLTNVVRHAPGASVLVTVRYSPERLFVAIDNTRPATTPVSTAPSGGHGIVGMSERATALGGRLLAEPKPDGGFHVEARLPVHLAHPEPAA
ncbi:sensor histidine kinase [Nocardia huaxiensis]|uniref:histidine kinase n=1 Tax=Nocardia huaxiensis TaxID=2755382 RepID=A0A7D6VBZ4_9NOCA|nr:histidine kinase [Nocardia huaxiensis]QLY31431.1 sensor histidine kinase [Nocardia huaxiensis]UFS94979.1 histidine kinase [Nocardia huaxiensis]